MFNRCLPYRVAIGEFLRNSNAEGSALEPSIGEWWQLARLSNFLGTLFKATVKLSCSYTPTAFELLKHLYQISKVYAELEEAESANSTLAPIVDAMKEKFLKYWEDVPLLVIIASCLNLAYKNIYTIMILEQYKRNLHLDPKEVKTQVESVFDEMFVLYNSRINVEENQPSSSRSAAAARSNNSGGLLRDFQLDNDPHTSQGTNELLGYISNLCEPEGVDIMDWWRRNASAYPTLAMMARDVFAVSVSTVPSECCFSSVNMIISIRSDKF